MSGTTARISAALPAFRAWLLRQPFFTSTILPALPRRVRWFLRRAYAFPLSLVERGNRPANVPPRALNVTGSIEGFAESGETLAVFNRPTDARTEDFLAGRAWQ